MKNIPTFGEFINESKLEKSKNAGDIYKTLNKDETNTYWIMTVPAVERYKKLWLKNEPKWSDKPFEFWLNRLLDFKKTVLGPDIIKRLKSEKSDYATNKFIKNGGIELY